jgi:arsenite methyltransferase
MAELTDLTPPAEPAVSGCCSPAAQETCCEPTAKAACCDTSAAGESCGCAAGRVPDADTLRDSGQRVFP